MYTNCSGDIHGSVRPQHLGLVEAVASAPESDFMAPFVDRVCFRPPRLEDVFPERLQFPSLQVCDLKQVN
jgi:hypothetical protein